MRIGLAIVLILSLLVLPWVVKLPFEASFLSVALAGFVFGLVSRRWCWLSFVMAVVLAFSVYCGLNVWIGQGVDRSHALTWGDLSPLLPGAITAGAFLGFIVRASVDHWKRKGARPVGGLE